MNNFFERYSDRIMRGGDDECWIWTGARASKGYGHTYRNGKHIYAHRAAYESVHGEGSAHGLLVRHKCDNPPCCNPNHLEVGTAVDNTRDMYERGRNNDVRGEAAGRSIITENQARQIRLLASRGVGRRELSNKFGIAYNSITAVITGKSWSHVGGKLRRMPRASSKLTEPDVKMIKILLKQGKTQSEVASIFGIARCSVSAIKTGRNWSHVDI